MNHLRRWLGNRCQVRDNILKWNKLNKAKLNFALFYVRTTKSHWTSPNFGQTHSKNLIIAFVLYPLRKICGIVYEYLKFILAEASKCLLDVDKQNPWDFLWKNVPHTFETYVRELQVVQESQFMNRPMLNPQVTTVWLANMMCRVQYQDLYSGYQLIQTPDTKVRFPNLYHWYAWKSYNYPLFVTIRSQSRHAQNTQVFAWNIKRLWDLYYAQARPDQSRQKYQEMHKVYTVCFSVSMSKVVSLKFHSE